MAKNYKTSNYGLNVNSEGIVYKYADGTIEEFTFEKISAIVPNFTKEDFMKLKEVSNKIYHEESKTDHYQTNYVKSSLDDSLDTDWLATESLEDDYFGKMKRSKQKKKIWAAINTKLTDVQRRRFLLHALKGLTEREIAELDGVDRRAVHDSLEASRKKLQKILKNI